MKTSNRAILLILTLGTILSTQTCALFPSSPGIPAVSLHSMELANSHLMSVFVYDSGYLVAVSECLVADGSATATRYYRYGSLEEWIGRGAYSIQIGINLNDDSVIGNYGDYTTAMLSIHLAGNVAINLESSDFHPVPSIGERLQLEWTHSFPYSAFNNIAVDNDGNLYFTDADTRVFKYNSTFELLQTWGGINGTAPGEFRGTVDIQIDENGCIYVADEYNHRIQRFSSTFSYLNSIGSFGSEEGQLKYPFKIELGLNNAVYVLDSQDNWIHAFSRDGTFLERWPIPSGRDIAVDENGIVFLAFSNDYPFDQVTVNKYSSEGMLLSSWTYPSVYGLVYSIAVGIGGRIFLGFELRPLYVISPSGELLHDDYIPYDAPVPYEMYSRNDGNIYIGHSGFFAKYKRVLY